MTENPAVSRMMRDIHQRITEAQDVVVSTRDGLPLASTTSDERAKRVSAMAASVLSLSVQALDGDETAHAVVRGTRGCLVVHHAGPDALLAVHTGAAPNMGLVQVEVPSVATDLQTAMDPAC